MKQPTAASSNPIFLEMNNNYAEANDTLTRRNSYLLAVESDEIMVSHATRANTDEASGSPTDGKIDNGNQKQKKKKAINFCRALLIPGVIVVSMCITMSIKQN